MKTLKVMIVEDEPFVAQFIEEIVVSLGHQPVYNTGDEREALDFLHKNPCDLVFLDINLNGNKEGIWLAGHMSKSMAIREKTAIIYVSAYSDQETVALASKTKPCNFITKPFGAKDLQIAISLVMEKRDLLNTIEFQDRYRYSFASGRLTKEAQEIRLTGKESDVLRVLLKNRNKLVTTEQLLYEVWPDKAVGESTLRDTVYRLRKKIPELALENLPKAGYILQI